MNDTFHKETQNSRISFELIKSLDPITDIIMYIFNFQTESLIKLRVVR